MMMMMMIDDVVVVSLLPQEFRFTIFGPGFKRSSSDLGADSTIFYFDS
jgi:hypothetical protein